MPIAFRRSNRRGRTVLVCYEGAAAPEEDPDMDAVFILLTFAFFGATWAYVRGCDRL
jgi:hypothetical protein